MYPFMEDIKARNKKNNFEVETKDYNDDDNDDNDYDNDDNDDNDMSDFREYILDMIKDAIKIQNETINYYKDLSKDAPNKKDKQILRKISLENVKFKDNFIKIYEMLMDYENMSIPEDRITTKKCCDFLERLENGIDMDLEHAEFYRVIMSTIADLLVRDMIYEVILGKLRHCNLINNMYTRNC